MEAILNFLLGPMVYVAAAAVLIRPRQTSTKSQMTKWLLRILHVSFSVSQTGERRKSALRGCPPAQVAGVLPAICLICLHSSIIPSGMPRRAGKAAEEGHRKRRGRMDPARSEIGPVPFIPVCRPPPPGCRHPRSRRRFHAAWPHSRHGRSFPHPASRFLH